MELRNKKGQYIKGHIPWCKYRKGIHLAPKTEFKKGHLPWRKYTKEHRKIYLKLYMEKWSKIHKKRRKKYMKNWGNSPKGKIHNKKCNSNRRAKTKDLTIKRIQQIYTNNIKKNGILTCYLCFKVIPFGKDHLEHKIPLSRGGTNAKENLDIACLHCNLSKNNKTVSEYKVLKRLTVK